MAFLVMDDQSSEYKVLVCLKFLSYILCNIAEEKRLTLRVVHSRRASLRTFLQISQSRLEGEIRMDVVFLRKPSSNNLFWYLLFLNPIVTECKLPSP